VKNKNFFSNLSLPLTLGILVGFLALYLSYVAGNWLLLFIIGLLLLAFALFARVQQGSWLAPGAFFALYWAVFVLLTLIIAPDFDVRPEGLLWILFSVFAVYIGSVIGLGKMLFKTVPSSERQTKIKNLSTYRKSNLNFPWLKQLVFLCSILGFGGVIILVLSAGFDISSLFSIESISKMGREYSIARYSNLTYREPELAVFLCIFVYLGALFGGVLFAKSSSKRDRLIALFPFIPAMGYMLILTTRASVYFTFIIWLSAYLAAYATITKGIISLFTRRNIVLILGFALLIFAIFTGALMSRYAVTIISTDSLFNIWHQLRVDIFGSGTAFTQWFAYHWQDNILPSFGIFTFTRPLIMIGMNQFHLPVTLAEIGGFSTNIFTLFYSLIMDFTLIGSIFILFVVGILGGRAFCQVIQGRYRCIYLLILMLFYVFTLCGFVGSLFSYTTILLAWIAFIFYLLFVETGRWLIKINQKMC